MNEFHGGGRFAEPAPDHSAYTSLRMDVATHLALTAYRNRLQASVDVDPERYPEWLRRQVTLGEAVAYLLHKQNSSLRRCRKRRKLAGREVPQQTGPADGSQAGTHADGQGDGDSPPFVPPVPCGVYEGQAGTL